MEILIVDDELRARNLLKAIIEKHCPDVHEIFESSTMLEGVELIRTKSPRLVFLDIEMPQVRGTEIFNYIKKEEVNFELVFATAYSEFAVRAFEMNAIDYLLKPVRPTRVVEIVNKVQASFEKESIQTRLDELHKTLKQQEFMKIGVPVADGIKFIPLDEIIRMEADGMYTKIYTLNDGDETISKPLKFFEHLLTSGKTFYRPHRSHICNLKFLKQYVRKDGNYIILEQGHSVPISKDKKDEFLQFASRF